MIVLGTVIVSHPSLVPSIIAAVGAVVAAGLVAFVALRAQSAHEQIEQIRRMVKEELDDKGRAAIFDKRLKRALREVLGEDSRNRRWYDRDNDEELDGA